MKDWKERAVELRKDGKTYKEISEIVAEEYYGDKKYGVSIYSRINSHVKRHINDDHVNLSVSEINNDKSQNETIIKRVAVQNQEPISVDSDWEGTELIRFAIMGDTQLGSKYSQITHLHNFYDICVKEGIKNVYHTGDITEGLKMRVGHEYELYAVSADEMLKDVILNYPIRDGITTYFITGNHDASIYKQVGYDIGHAISNSRPDLKYIGRDCAKVNLTPNCTLELRHPWDGTAYALSYKIQKMIEAMESDSKPNILAVGHYHKAEYMFYRNVHALQTGCFQGQTPFTRGKGISIHVGGWIVSIRVDKQGTIKSFSPEFIPYYASIADDYKKYLKAGI